MIRLGWHLYVHSGRTALTRLILTAAAVGLGVGLLLSVAALYHGYQTTTDRACWPCTGQSLDAPPDQSAGPVSTEPAAGVELWDYSDDFYRGQAIERVDVATLGPQAPVVPGLTRMPSAGEFFASPALAQLIATVPPDQLGQRFPGHLAGLIAPAGLAGPDDLAVVVGRAPAELATARHTMRITAIQSAPQRRGDGAIYRFGFALGAVALLLPMLMLIGNATRLATARQAERQAALRLVGATPQQVRVIATVDAAIGSFLGAALGIGLSVALHPLTARVTITGYRFFPQYVWPTVTEYAAVLIGVPVAAAVAALVALRRVQISPLGVARRATPPPPRAWRVIPLGLGLVVFLIPLAFANRTNPSVGVAPLGLALIMVGLVIGGGWLTARAARLLARLGRGPAALLAARRVADEPVTTFRSVSGLILAVFVGTLLAAVVPAALAAQQGPTATALNPVLRFSFEHTANATAADQDAVLANLRSVSGAAVLPIYEQEPTGPVLIDPESGPPPAVVPCAALAGFSALGRCGPGVSAVQAGAESLTTDNLATLDRLLPLVSAASPAFTGDVRALPIRLVLVSADNPATVERIRTFLAVTYPGLTGGSGLAPQTFGEVASTRAALYNEVGTVVLIIVALTLLVAGCSLAIAMGGAVIDRRRPFTLLRVSGTSTRVLRRVVLLESLLPLAGATLVAAAIGVVAAIPINRVLSPTATQPVHFPDHTYYLTMAAGLTVAVVLIAATLPLLNRVTLPDHARFE
jgi:hypothetical protein